MVQVRNARLGMLAALGFAVQAWVTGKGPIQNAIDHLRDPFGQNGEWQQKLIDICPCWCLLLVPSACNVR